MMKGMKSLVRGLVLSVKGSFAEKREYSLRDYRVNGITVKHYLYPSLMRRSATSTSTTTNGSRLPNVRSLKKKIDRMSPYLQEHQGMKLDLGHEFRKYFDLIYYHEGQDDEKFTYGRERYNVIDEEIALCGYFVIITSEKMDAAEALDLYKSRDASEKLFREDKTFLETEQCAARPTRRCTQRSSLSL